MKNIDLTDFIHFLFVIMGFVTHAGPGGVLYLRKVYPNFGPHDGLLILKCWKTDHIRHIFQLEA